MSPSFGRAVRAAREAAGWTQEYLAKEAAISRKYLSQIERGEVDPSLSIVERLAIALDLTTTIPMGRPRGQAEDASMTALAARLRQVYADIGNIAMELAPPPRVVLKERRDARGPAQSEARETSHRDEALDRLVEMMAFIEQQPPSRREQLLRDVRDTFTVTIVKGERVDLGEPSWDAEARHSSDRQGDHTIREPIEARQGEVSSITRKKSR